MVRINVAWLPVILLSVGVCGCEHASDNERAGEVVGGASGALIGAQIGAGTGQLVGIGVGAVIGALAGGAIAHDASKDPLDTQRKERIVPPPVRQVEVEKPRYKATKHTVASKKNGHSRCYREYTHQGIIDGKPVKIHGTAHMRADGTWYVPDCPQAK